MLKSFARGYLLIDDVITKNKVEYNSVKNFHHLITKLKAFTSSKQGPLLPFSKAKHTDGATDRGGGCNIS